MPTFKVLSSVILIILSSNFASSHSAFQNISVTSSDTFKSVEKNLIKFFDHQKTIIYNFDNDNVTVECKEAVKAFKKSLENLEEWALEMYDANPKLPSGILNGNIHQFGDYDQCMSPQVQHEFLQGKYCLSHIMVDISDDNEYLNHIKHRILSLNPFLSDFNDISHILPKGSEVKLASCIPSACNANDLEISLKETLKELLLKFPVNVRVQVNETDCQERNNQKSYGIGEKLSFAFFIILIGIIIASTVADSYFHIADEHLTAFSLKRNFTELISVESTSSDIKSMHCIRSIFSIILISAHKSLEQQFNPIQNKLQMNNFLLQPMFVPLRTGYLHTEIFLMFSGFLATQTFIARIHRGQKINVIKEIIGRYFRLMPSIAILIIFVTFILPNLGSGPLWPMLINYQADLCKRTWLASMFMVQNFVGLENICMMHTHHIATDFQLFLITPAVAVMICKHPKGTVMGLIVAAGVSSIGRFIVPYFWGYSIFVTAGVRIPVILDSSNYLYLIPPYRFTVYSMGILLAYYLHKNKKTQLSQNSISTGWILWILSNIVTTVICFINEEQTPLRAALYASICSITFCFSAGWIIYVSELGGENVLSPFLEWKYWKISANLSYALYLVQFAVFHYNVGTMRGSIPFRLLGSILDLNELFIIIIAAVVLTVCVDYPFKNIKKLILDRKPMKVEDKSQ